VLANQNCFGNDIDGLLVADFFEKYKAIIEISKAMSLKGV